MAKVNPEDTLMSFRTAWLRAIALAWENPTFQNKLVRDSKKALSEIGFRWPWNGTVDLTISQDDTFVWSDSPKRGAQPGWTWPIAKNSNEWLVLYLPLLPKNIHGKDINEAHQPSALADYYDGQPTLFGSTNDGGSKSAPQKLGPSLIGSGRHNARSTEVPSVGDTQIRRNAGKAAVSSTREALQRGSKQLVLAGPSFIGPGTDFMNFEVALLLLLADYWKDGDKVGSESIGSRTLAAALEGCAKRYRIPWALNISVRNDPTIRWDKKNGTWRNRTPHMLQLELPTVPTHSTSRAVALAEYNATGAEFPFSCCCP